MAGRNAQNQSWSNWTSKVKGGDADGQSYWGFYSNNSAPVPVINNDNSATFTQKLQRFNTTVFARNGRMAATVPKYSGGLSTFNPEQISKAGWVATASSPGVGGSPAGGIDGNISTQWNTGGNASSRRQRTSRAGRRARSRSGEVSPGDDFVQIETLAGPICGVRSPDYLKKVRTGSRSDKWRG
ncbi:hypothetical protein AB0P19_13685 [Microbacterium oleivorans]|uniref:hypothetical protein n=1 Tax=Microbacterium TaxID=33882 RepID=UPI003410B9C6